MSEILRISLMSDYRSRVRSVLPMASDADMREFDALWARDCVVAADGGPHPELMAWVQRILDRDAPGAMAVPVRPVPSKGPAGAEVVL